MVCLAKRGCCLDSWMSSGASGVLFFCLDCVQFLSQGVKGFSPSRTQDSPCPRVFNKPALFALNFSQIRSSSWPWIVLCPNIDPLKHSKLLPDAQTTSALRHLKCLLQSMPLERQKSGSESSLVLDVFYLTEYIFHAIYRCPLRFHWVPFVSSSQWCLPLRSCWMLTGRRNYWIKAQWGQDNWKVSFRHCQHLHTMHIQLDCMNVSLIFIICHLS